MQNPTSKTRPEDANTPVRHEKPLTDLTPTRKQEDAVKGGGTIKTTKSNTF